MPGWRRKTCATFGDGYRNGQDVRQQPGIVHRIVARCERLADFPLRGTRRDDLAPGVRTVSFERRLLIVYRAVNNEVTVLRVLHGARDVPTVFGEG